MTKSKSPLNEETEKKPSFRTIMFLPIEKIGPNDNFLEGFWVYSTKWYTYSGQKWKNSAINNVIRDYVKG